MLANRLKLILLSIISPNQCAFVHGWLITDYIMVAYETLHTMHTHIYGNQEYMALKLDMSKAYNKLEWGFIHVVMETYF